jgi:hypothetical protein
MSTKKRRCDTRSPSPFETPPAIAREEHCKTGILVVHLILILLSATSAWTISVHPIVPPFGRRLLEKTQHSEKRPKLLRFYYRADNVPVYSPVKLIDLEM